MRLERNQFIIIVDDIPEEMENEFLSLVNNISKKDLFKQEKKYQISEQRYHHNIQK